MVQDGEEGRVGGVGQGGEFVGDEVWVVFFGWGEGFVADCGGDAGEGEDGGGVVLEFCQISDWEG